jgi:hypothetical protein
MTRSLISLRLPLCLTLALPLASFACNGEHDDDDHSDYGHGTEAEGDGDPTGDGDPGDGDPTGDKPALGDTPNVLCEAALFNLAMIVAENQSGSPDPLTIEAAYVGTGLQDFVQLAGAVTGRIVDGVLIDDAAILASLDSALDGGDPRDMVDIEWRIYLAMQQYIRAEINTVYGTLPDPANHPALLYARWDAAYCYWDGGLRPLAQIADGIGLPNDSIEADIDAAFVRGHAGIEGVEPWAIDLWEVGPAKQQAEKSTFTLAHRLVMQWSADAASVDNPAVAGVLAHAAYGAFQMVRDRIATKNTPGIAIIEDALLGDPAQIDADEVLRHMNIAFAKRTRRYTDLALPDNANLFGTSEGVTGATEGRIYSKLIEPFMLELDGFDLAAYEQTWFDWIDAIATDDVPTGEAASAELTHWNCEFQAAIGIATCSWDLDEI